LARTSPNSAEQAKGGSIFSVAPARAEFTPACRCRTITKATSKPPSIVASSGIERQRSSITHSPSINTCSRRRSPMAIDSPATLQRYAETPLPPQAMADRWSMQRHGLRIRLPEHSGFANCCVQTAANSSAHAGFANRGYRHWKSAIRAPRRSSAPGTPLSSTIHAGRSTGITTDVPPGRVASSTPDKDVRPGRRFQPHLFFAIRTAKLQGCCSEQIPKTRGSSCSTLPVSTITLIVVSISSDLTRQSGIAQDSAGNQPCSSAPVRDQKESIRGTERCSTNIQRFRSAFGGASLPVADGGVFHVHL